MSRSRQCPDRSIEKFCEAINRQVSASGAVFSANLTADGSVEIWRSSATSGTWSVLYPRVIYTSVADVIIAGDGSGQAVSTAPAFIAGLN